MRPLLIYFIARYPDVPHSPVLLGRALDCVIYLLVMSTTFKQSMLLEILFFYTNFILSVEVAAI